MTYLILFPVIWIFLIQKVLNLTSQPDGCLFQTYSATYSLAGLYGVCFTSPILDFDHTLINAQTSNNYKVGKALEAIEYRQPRTAFTIMPHYTRTPSMLTFSVSFDDCGYYKALRYRIIIFYLSMTEINMDDYVKDYFPTTTQSFIAGQGRTIAVTGLTSINTTGTVKISLFLFQFHITSTDIISSKSIEITSTLVSSTSIDVTLYNRGSRSVNIFSLSFTIIRVNIDELALLYPDIQILSGDLSKPSPLTFTDTKLTNLNTFYGLYKFNHDTDTLLQFDSSITSNTLTLSTTGSKMYLLGINYFVIVGNQNYKCCSPTPFYQSITKLCYDSCLVGFYGLFNKCIACSTTITNCLQCIDATNCTKCSDGYFIDSGLCTPCQAYIAQCLKCTSASACTACNIGFYSSGPVCDSCQVTIQNCALCTSNTSCTKCSIGYFNSVSKCNLCNSTMNFCSQCTDSSHCTKCMNKYYLKGLTCDKCSTPIPNCQTCNSVPQCITCMIGYYLDGLTCQSCTGLDSKCIQCSDATICSKCQYGYFPTGKKCQMCTVYGQSCIQCDTFKCINKKSALFQDITNNQNDESFCSINLIACICIAAVITAVICCFICNFQTIIGGLIIYCCFKPKESQNNQVLNVTQETLNNQYGFQGTFKSNNSNHFINQDEINLTEQKSKTQKQGFNKKRKSFKNQLTYRQGTPLSTNRNPPQRERNAIFKQKQLLQDQTQEKEIQIKLNQENGQFQIIQLDKQKNKQKIDLQLE